MSTHSSSGDFLTRAIFLAAVCLCALPLRGADRFYLGAKVNGQPAVFVFDTGADRSLLWASGAHRLGLTNLLGGEVGCFASTEPCTVELGRTSCRFWFGVLDLPTYVDEGSTGILGWRFLSNNILRLDAERGAVAVLDKLPDAMNGWIKVPIKRGLPPVLLLDVRDHAKEKALLIDTGSQHGVSLPAEGWLAWRKANPKLPATYDVSYNPWHGIALGEETWADTISLGPLTLTAAPVMQAGPADLSAASNYYGTLGMAALQRFDVILDGPGGAAYFQPRKSPAPPYGHNRIGADFVPRDERADDLIGHVLADSPAYSAGVRNGDVLLKVNGIVVTNWRHTISSGHELFTKSPPGSKIALTLKRGVKTLTAMVTCRQILGPLPATSGTPVELTNDFSSGTVRVTTNDATDYFDRGYWYLSRQKYELGIADFNQAIRLDPGDPDSYYNRGQCYNSLRQFDSGISNFTEYVKLRPKDPDGYLARGAAYADLSDLTSAVRDLSESIRLGNTNAFVLAMRGRAYYLKNDFEKAARDFSDALRLDPANKQNLLYRGASYDRLEKIDLGIKDLTEYMRFNPTNAEPYLERGAAYMYRSEDAKAIDDLTRALELNPKLPLAHRYRGSIHSRHGRYLEAAFDFGKTVALDPNDAEAYESLAWLQATCSDDLVRDGNEAVANATKACELTEWKARNPIRTLAAAYAEAGDFKKAVEYEKKALLAGAPSEEEQRSSRARIDLYEHSQPYRTGP